MVHILHFSDIHIRDGFDSLYIPVFDKLLSEVRNSLSKKKTYVVITGDIFHVKKSYTTSCLKQFYYLFERLNGLCPTYLIYGNHDYDNSSSKPIHCFHELLTGFDNVKLLCDTKECEDQDGGLAFLTLPLIVEDDNKEGLTPSFPVFSEKVKDKFKIALYHGTITEDDNYLKFNNDCISSRKCKPVSWVAKSGADLILLGDLHEYRKFKNYNCFYSGSLIQQTISESVDGHGLIIYDTESNTHNFIQIAQDKNYKLQINWKNDNFYINNSLTKKKLTKEWLKKASGTTLLAAAQQHEQEYYQKYFPDLTNLKNQKTKKLFSIVNNENSITQMNAKLLEIQDKINQNITDINYQNKTWNVNESISPINLFSQSTPDTFYIKKIESEYILNYKHLQIDFSNINNNTICIHANNGVGKSNIFYTIYLALYGELPKSDNSTVKSSTREYINNNITNEQKKSTTVIDFQIKDDIYTLSRTWYVSSSTQHVILTKNNTITISDKYRDCQKWISTNLLSPTDFLCLYMNTQHNQKTFIDSTNRERYDFIANVFNLEDILSLKLKLKSTQDILENKKKDAESKLNTFKFLLAKTEDYELKYQQFNKIDTSRFSMLKKENIPDQTKEQLLDALKKTGSSSSSSSSSSTEPKYETLERLTGDLNIISSKITANNHLISAKTQTISHMNLYIRPDVFGLTSEKMKYRISSYIESVEKILKENNDNILQYTEQLKSFPRNGIETLSNWMSEGRMYSKKQLYDETATSECPDISDIDFLIDSDEECPEELDLCRDQDILESEDTKYYYYWLLYKKNKLVDNLYVPLFKNCEDIIFKKKFVYSNGKSDLDLKTYEKIKENIFKKNENIKITKWKTIRDTYLERDSIWEALTAIKNNTDNLIVVLGLLQDNLALLKHQIDLSNQIDVVKKYEENKLLNDMYLDMYTNWDLYREFEAYLLESKKSMLYDRAHSDHISYKQELELGYQKYEKIITYLKKLKTFKEQIITDYNNIIRDIIIPFICNNMNTVLKCLNENMTVTTLEKKIKSTQELTGDFEWLCKIDSKNPINIWRLSGFQKMIIDIAFRYAFSTLKYKTTFHDKLYLDETLSVVDSKRIDNISVLFNHLSTIYKHIVIVSHDEKLKSFADTTLSIANDGVFSTLIV